MIPIIVMWSALLLGIITSISPCPLATNIAAISFIGRSLVSPRKVLLSGLLYTLGRMFVYMVLGVIILKGFEATTANPALAGISRFLQTYMGMILGPVLVFAGMVILGMIDTTISLSFNNSALQEKVKANGVLWSFPMGILFALSFCPVSASLFFIGLIGLSAQHSSPVLLPTLYGVGTALPVLAFAFIIAFAGKYVGKAYNRLAQIEKWMRLATGIIFIVAGLYYTLTYIYGLKLF